jgi:hypothetical protein
VVVESDGTPETAHVCDGDPFGLQSEEGILVGLTWLGRASKDSLKNFDREVVDGVGNI